MANSSSSSVVKEFTAMGLVWRFLAALALVVLTYNPSGFSFIGWVQGSLVNGDLGPEHFVSGVLVVIGWAILLVATQRSLGNFGLVLVAAFLGGIVWLLTDIGLLAVGSFRGVVWVSLVCLAALLTIGLTWSHIWKRLTGQVEVDDGDGK